MVKGLGYDLRKKEEKVPLAKERKKWTKEVRPFMLLVLCVVMTIGTTMLSISTLMLSGLRGGS
jgi:hypothetical protein